MSQSARAAVRPMVFGRFGGPAIPLESVVERMLRARAAGLVLVSGVAGSGRSTAVDHLRAVFAGESGVHFLDEPQSRDVIEESARRLLVLTASLPSTSANASVRDFGDDRAVVVLHDGNARLLTRNDPPIPLLDITTPSPRGVATSGLNTPWPAIRR